MERIRKTKIVFSRGNPGLIKPVSQITDRAKRYRANRAEVRPLGPKRCAYCGSGRNVGVHHKNGNEDVNKRSNLAWACKSCNASIAVIHKRNGIGKRTRQFNAGKKRSAVKGATTLGQYHWLVMDMRNLPRGSAEQTRAYEAMMATPDWMRSAYSKNAADIKAVRRGVVPF